MLYVLTKNDSLLKLLAVNFITGTVCARPASTWGLSSYLWSSHFNSCVQQSLLPMIYLMYHLLNRWFWYSHCHFSYSYTVSVVLIFSSQFIYRLFQHHSAVHRNSKSFRRPVCCSSTKTWNTEFGNGITETESVKEVSKRSIWKKISNDKKINKQIK